MKARKQPWPPQGHAWYKVLYILHAPYQSHDALKLGSTKNKKKRFYCMEEVDCTCRTSRRASHDEGGGRQHDEGGGRRQTSRLSGTINQAIADHRRISCVRKFSTSSEEAPCVGQTEMIERRDAVARLLSSLEPLRGSLPHLVRTPRIDGNLPTWPRRTTATTRQRLST